MDVLARGFGIAIVGRETEERGCVSGSCLIEVGESSSMTSSSGVGGRWGLVGGR